MLDCEKVSSFICNKFLKVYKAIKEDTYLLVKLLELMEMEMTLFIRF